MKSCCEGGAKRNVAAYDLVCGMTTDNPDGFIKHIHEDKEYYFCSHDCLEKFKEDPDKYIPGRRPPVKKQGKRKWWWPWEIA